ncbi:tyrosine-type recombinase/integrase [Methanolobus profundi]|uniref:Phage integrase, N-terminal SAM-like domain n=1 Tax=Methanolobus profundi TaxID=487685 RepID=A0A1I4UND9_9EURY|nr:tyrosine-type recombinase/integrase [Methanolobus profundi]SFM90435.1 Phage integrase, N-terminal SAM-like domain [Methanolobus profundi]
MELLKAYLDDCKVRGLELRTIQSYKSSCKEFLDYFPEPEAVNKFLLVEYLQHLQERGKRPSTIQRDFSAISGLYEYMRFMDLVTNNPVLQIRSRYLEKNYEPDRRFIPELQDMKRLLRAIQHDEDEMIREVAMISTLAKTASRRGEYLELKEEDIDLERDEIYWPSKKKRRIRLGFIDNELHNILEEYLEWRAPRAKTDYLWISNRGGRIHKDDTNNILAYYAEPLGLHNPNGPLHKKLTCHCLRGFFTTQMQRAGMQEVYIKWLRGDSLKKKTWASNYIEFDPELVRKEYLSCVPALLD